MNNYETDDTFLGRWISGELSEEERIAFEKTKEFKQFAIINSEAQLLEGPTIDTEAALLKIKQLVQAKPKVIRLKQIMRMAVAAIVIVSLGFFLNSSKTYTTAIGETHVVTLADGSIINLNANSSVSHKRFFWDTNKGVSLNGEAYFTITKGNGFTVQTSKGIVTVLGTQFNIKDRANFDLKCFEGKVKFKANNINKKSYLLTKGMQVSIDKNNLQENLFSEQNPDWKNGMSSFTNQPISIVLDELMNYYPIEFERKNINTNRLFSGSFTHDNLKTALQATLVPMGIQYQISDSNETIILSE
ncbi:MAG: FecR domain-containing protein [Flavobacteriaceae bacterium]|nr:FecR domain-containing protein [Flavobacteriaceae bacterium]